MVYIYLIVFLALVAFGLPVAFALGVPAVIYAFTVDMSLVFIPQTMVAPIQSFVLLALPCFLLAGRMMNAAGITDRLVNFAVALVGRVRAGLLYANSLASMFFASMSGTAIGDAGGLGLVLMNMMQKSGYKLEIAAGITAASSIIGPIIPPSAVMVILAASANISIGRLFIAGVVPGLLMTLALMITIFLRANFTAEGKSWPIEKVPAKNILTTFFPAFFPLLTPVIVLGGIISGIVTPTEAAALASVYALILGLFYRQITIKKLWETLENSIITIGTFMIIVSIANLFTWMLTRVGLANILTDVILNFSQYGDTIAVLFLVMILFVLGMIMDTVPAILILAPILFPIMRLAEIDVIYFGLVMIVALIIGLITPPYGMVIFVISEVTGLSVAKVTRQTIKYLPAMLIVLLILILFPKLSTWLPNLILN